jgi:hypothetical protein
MLRWVRRLDGHTQAVLGFALASVAAGSLMIWPSPISFLIVLLCGIPGMVLFLVALIRP